MLKLEVQPARYMQEHINKFWGVYHTCVYEASPQHQLVAQLDHHQNRETSVVEKKIFNMRDVVRVEASCVQKDMKSHKQLPWCGLAVSSSSRFKPVLSQWTKKDQKKKSKVNSKPHLRQYFADSSKMKLRIYRTLWGILEETDGEKVSFRYLLSNI